MANAPKESLCRNGCGKNVHFNRNNPQGFQNDGTPKGKWTPLEYGPQGEVVHNCPNRQNYQAPPAQQPAPGAQYGQPQAPPQNAGPTVTQLLLDEARKQTTLLSGILAMVSEQVGMLKALHPDLVKPVENKPLPPEVTEPTPADELPAQ